MARSPAQSRFRFVRRNSASRAGSALKISPRRLKLPHAVLPIFAAAMRLRFPHSNHVVDGPWAKVAAAP